MYGTFILERVRSSSNFKDFRKTKEVLFWNLEEVLGETLLFRNGVINFQQRYRIIGRLSHLRHFHREFISLQTFDVCLASMPLCFHYPTEINKCSTVKTGSVEDFFLRYIKLFSSSTFFWHMRMVQILLLRSRIHWICWQSAHHFANDSLDNRAAEVWVRLLLVLGLYEKFPISHTAHFSFHKTNVWKRKNNC